jgi:hypothetical protein
MATSGSSNFAITLADIIEDAYEICGSYQAGEVIDPNDFVVAKRKLNMMVKAMMQQGLHLWAIQEATLFLSPGVGSYSLGITGTHCTTSYVSTTLSTDEATSSTSIGLTSFTGMSASDNIGVVLDDGSLHWTTISGAPGATTTIATGLPSAATAGAVVFAYTSKINRPLRIVPDSAYYHSINNDDIPITMVSRTDYAQLSNKVNRGKIIQAFYDAQLTTGIMKVWLTPDSATDVLRFSFERPLEDFDSTTNNPDFPIEYGECLSYQLAVRLCPGLGVPPPMFQVIKMEAEQKLEMALGFDRENVSISIEPDYYR